MNSALENLTAKAQFSVPDNNLIESVSESNRASTFRMNTVEEIESTLSVPSLKKSLRKKPTAICSKQLNMIL